MKNVGWVVFGCAQFGLGVAIIAGVAGVDPIRQVLAGVGAYSALYGYLSAKYAADDRWEKR